MSLFKMLIATYGTLLLLLQDVFAANAPTINCYGLPWCNDDSKQSPSDADVWGEHWNMLEFIINIIHSMLQYVTVIAVIALMISGIMYLLSGGEEEKVKKAKNWIIWSLVGVIVSMSSWFLVSLINDFGDITPIITS